MQFFLWLKNVTWRTTCAFIPALAQPDDAYAKQLLSKLEYGLYLTMDKRDRAHACQVCKAVQAELAARPVLLRAALLHDLGKSEGVYNPFERIFVHLFSLRDLPAEPRLKGLRGAWQRRQHHAFYGAQTLRQAGACEAVARIVEHHHSAGIDADADQLKLIEDRY